MSDNESEEIRSAAESLITQIRVSNMPYRGGAMPLPPGFDMTRHSINLITEEFLGGYMQDGRMSVVRRFFCLFVTFDLFFVSLLWLICIMITGDNIFQAFEKQILHYTIHTSLFDVVVAAICRFLVLIIVYALLYANHWFIIALSTSGSCLFLISKVFVFDWIASSQQVFQVIIILTSFVLAWGEAWFLDCRVIPQERHALRYFSNVNTNEVQSPMLAPFLASQAERHQRPESIFYSPLDSVHNSDEEDEKDEEYLQMGLECLQKTFELLESGDWKVEKANAKGDTIYSTQRDKLGKIFRLTGRIKYPAKALMEELFYKVESVPKWNPTLLESKILRKINSYTDITYQATLGGGGGMIKSRDFVNLRCWRLYKNGKLCSNNDDAYEQDTSDEESILNRSCEGSVISTVSGSGMDSQPSSVGSVERGISKYFKNSATAHAEAPANPYQTLSKSLGAKDFSAMGAAHIDFSEPPPLDEEFEDAQDNLGNAKQTTAAVESNLKYPTKDKVWISSAISVDYPQCRPSSKYIRGENIVAGFAMREIAGKPDACIFEWILCLNLKGLIPRYVLDNAYTTFMTDYMTYLRKYVNELRQNQKRVPRT